MAGIVVKPRARIFHGHDWVYGSEVLKIFGDPQAGDVISLKDGRDRLLGSAIFNPRSQIVARRFSRRKQELDVDFFVRRISQAIDSREKLGVNRNPGRIVWSESDALPGVVLDRYGPYLVLQTLTLAMDQRKHLIVEAAQKLLSPTSIVERNEAPVRKAEGMELVTGVLSGEQPRPLVLEVRGMCFEIDVLGGQKTGFYLDQLDNYEAVAGFAGGLRVLDCFSNQGAFAIACAKADAASVTAVEISADLVQSINQNAQRNAASITVQEANAFDFLARRIREKSEYDLIVLDPPSFARSKDSLNNAWRGYKQIHLRALQLLAHEGFLATFSCSHHVSREMFLEMIVDASVDAKKHVRTLRQFSQPLDHPVLPHIPETEYLKGFLFQVLPGR
jgi:23S rRNA (cytosine1962-C5)-methyltransferase